MENEKPKDLTAILLAILVVSVIRGFGLVVGSILISHGLEAVGFDVSSATVGMLIAGLYFTKFVFEKIKL